MNRVDLTNTFKIFMCCVGAIIGAGFASGQEIMSFFIKYGKSGLWGLVICGILFALYIFFALGKIRNRNICSFNEYFGDIMGKALSDIVQIIAYGFMFASFCVMVSGSGAVAEELFGFNTLGIVFMTVLCFVVFLNGVDGMVCVNAFMTPLIIIGVIAVGVYAFFGASEAFAPFDAFCGLADNFFVSSVLYVSYNTITLIGVLIPLKDKITSNKVALYSGVLSGGVLGVMAVLLWGAIWIFKDKIAGAQVPMLTIAQSAGTWAGLCYGAVLYMAMITTAVSSGFALISFLKEKTRLGSGVLSFALCGVSVPLAYVGFANLVDKLYRFFGFLGVFVLVVVLLDGVKNTKSKKMLDKQKNMY